MSDETFSDDLDALIDKWRKKPMDDRPSCGFIVGALMFRCHMIMMDAERYAERLDEGRGYDPRSPAE